MFATYSGRDNVAPVEFHLREKITDTQDLRTVVIDPSELGDNQLHDFLFEPVADSRGKSFFFFITSPKGSLGNAVTVDLNTQDPYHEGAAYVVRGVEGFSTVGLAGLPVDVINRSGKQTVDVVFSIKEKVSLRAAVVTKIRRSYQTFVGTWQARRGYYQVWVQSFLPTLGFFAVLFLMRQSLYLKVVGSLGKGRFTALVLTVLFGAGLMLRLIYASEMPITNDEGNYLYDAASALRGVLAGGDGYVKAPLVIAWVALWQSLLGNTVLAGRVASVVAGLLTMFPLYFLAKDLWSSRAVTKAWLPHYLTKVSDKKVIDEGWGRRVGLVTAAIWTLFGAPVVFSIYVHTQPVAILLGVSGLAVLLAALRGTVPRLSFFPGKHAPAGVGWFVLAGVLLGLGVASRKSILALGLLPLLFIALEGKDMGRRIRHLVAVGVGFCLVIGIFVAGAYVVYGEVGVREALGLSSAENGLAVVEESELDQVRQYSLRGITPFFRESLPFIIFSVMGLGIVFEQMIRAFFRKIPPVSSRITYFGLDYALPLLGWIPAWLMFGWGWRFFFEYEGEVFFGYGIEELWFLFGLLLLVFTFLPRPKSEGLEFAQRDTQEVVVRGSAQLGRVSMSQSQDLLDKEEERMSVWRHVVAALAVPTWLGGLGFFYANWIKFHANYIAEFLPPLTILAAFGAVALFHRVQPRLFLAKDYPIVEILRRIAVGGIVLVLMWSITVSNYITFVFEHTGTFAHGSVQQAAAYVRKHIPVDEALFTGAAVVPYISNYRTALDIAHPRWYAYEFTRKDTDRLETFLPPATKMVEAFRAAQWVLLESQTGFSFLMEYSEIEKGIETDFVLVEEIENLGNPLKFYRRVR